MLNVNSFVYLYPRDWISYLPSFPTQFHNIHLTNYYLDKLNKRIGCNFNASGAIRSINNTISKDTYSERRKNKKKIMAQLYVQDTWF